MAQINLSFRELIDITSTLDTYAREIREISVAEAERASALANELHARFAKARTAADDAEDWQMTQEVLGNPDARLPDAVDYFKKHISHCFVCPAMAACNKAFKNQPDFGGTECITLIADWLRLQRMAIACGGDHR